MPDRVALAHVAYGRPFRGYQAMALDAFERARADGRRRTYLVMPPGSGKTVLGLEIARRLGRPTLVFSPNTAIQEQWVREWRDFEPLPFDATTDPSLPTPITSLTYQALCNLESHAEQLDDATLAAWHAERADAGRLGRCVGVEQDWAQGRLGALPRRVGEDLGAAQHHARGRYGGDGELLSVQHIQHPRSGAGMKPV